MNKNQKIALGCGVAGCLGLIVIVIIIVVLGVAGYVSLPGVSSSNRNYNSNRNSNYNSNTNTDSNTNSNSDSSSSSTMSDDDKHKLFQAAISTNDNQLRIRVLEKIGFPTGSGPEYSDFVSDHFAWALKNLEFMETINTAAKARAYVEDHIDD